MFEKCYRRINFARLGVFEEVPDNMVFCNIVKTVFEKYILNSFFTQILYDLLESQHLNHI